jgi:tripartite-type tricarboxylate transporter receptor subunit TctC
MRTCIAVILSAFTFLSGHSAHAQTYPNKPIRVIVPHSVGGSPDSMARIIAQKFSENIGQPVVVETRLGAGGMIGTNSVITAPADGYTLLFADSSAYAITPHMFRDVSFDPLKNLAPIMPAATIPVLLTVPAGLNVSNVKEFIALAKSKPGMFYGSSGSGTPHHLAMELFKSQAGVDLSHISYKGSGQSVLALIAGEVSAGFLGIPAALPQAKAGKLKILAVSTGTRVPQIPDIPTIAESGVPGFDIKTSVGFFAPLKTPPAIIARLNAELQKAVKSPEVQERLIALGLGNTPTLTPQQYARFARNEFETFGALVKKTGGKAD